METIEVFLKEKAREGSLRQLRPLDYRREGKVYVEGKEFIDFSSNDYLGLSAHPKLIAAAKDALDKFGASVSASRLLSGDFKLHHFLEEKVAHFKNKERALVFNSGYQANTGIISALYSRGDAIFSDRLNHASIVDGIRLSQAALFRFLHNDLDHLEGLLKKERKRFKKALIVTETIFSMDGDRPDLKRLINLKERYDCQIMVDEAHATGIYGKNGSGLAEEEAVTEKIDFVMGTFSKALGGFGAYLASSNQIIEYLINTCRSFIYSTALPVPVIVCNLAGIELIREEPRRREELLKEARFFRDALKNIGLNVKGDSHIVPLVIGENMKTVKCAKILQEKGYWVFPIRPPTVPQKEARLRFSLTFYHDKEIIEKLINDIKEAGI